MTAQAILDPLVRILPVVGFLLAITLVTGILVDDAIVEIENIARHMHMGKPPYEASEEAAAEIGTAVIAISFSIVAVFAPVGESWLFRRASIWEDALGVPVDAVANSLVSLGSK